MGNWFNQELFGRPTDLPWALEIAPRHRPAGYEDQPTFHPTFLYESLWNLSVVGLVLFVERRTKGRLRPGALFAVYVSGYTLGRFVIENVRIDSASKVGGLRVNVWVSGVAFVVSTFFAVREIRRAAKVQPADPAPSASGASAGEQADQAVAKPAQ